MITTVTQKGQATIPVNIRRKLGIKPGQKVYFEEIDNKVILRSVPDFLTLMGSLKTKKPFDIKAMKRTAREYVVNEYVKKHVKAR